MTRSHRPPLWAVSHYPVSRLIAELLKERGESWDELAHRLPYPEFNNALSNLSTLACEGVCVNRLRRALSVLLEMPPGKLEACISETAAQKADEHEAAGRKDFSPHIRVCHFKPTCRIFILAFTLGGAVNPIPLPVGIACLPDEERMGIIRKLIKKHRAEYSDNSGIELLGGIQGYVCHLEYKWKSVFLDPDGNISEYGNDLISFVDSPTISLV